MLFQDKSAEAVAESFRKTLAASEQDRREKTRLLLDMYTGDWDPQLEARIDKVFQSPENRTRAKTHLDTSWNLFVWLAGKVGAIYDKPPRRTFGDEEPDGYQELIESAQLDLTMAEACKLTSALGETAVRPVVTSEGGLRYDTLTPEVVEVYPHQDDPTSVEAMIYEEWVTDVEGKPRKRYVFWDAERHLVFDDQWKRVVVEGNEDGTNPYQMIPWVFLHARWPVRVFWHEDQFASVREATLNAGMALTDFGLSFKEGCFKQLALTGRPGEAWAQQQVREPGTPITTGDGTASVLDMVAPFDVLMNAIERRASMTAHFAGMNPAAVKGGLDASSGYALRLKMQELEAVWNAQRLLYGVWEDRLYRATARVWNVHQGRDVLPEDITPSVQWADVGPDAQPQDLADYWAGLYDKGLCTYEEAIRGARPQLTDEQVADVAVQTVADKRSQSVIPLTPPGASAAAEAMRRAQGAE